MPLNPTFALTRLDNGLPNNAAAKIVCKQDLVPIAMIYVIGDVCRISMMPNMLTPRPRTPESTYFGK